MFRRQKADNAPDEPFWKQRGWVFSAVFLVTVLIAAGLSFLTRSDGEPAAAPESKPKAGPLSTPKAEHKEKSDDERPKGCRTEDDEGRDSEIPTAAPKDVTWKPVGSSMVPMSPSAGPTQMNGSVWWCYSRTPMGAVMAAHSILTHMSDADWRDVAEQQVLPEEGRKTFISERAAMSQEEVEAEDTGVYSGFVVTAYTKNEARVRILMKSASGTQGSTTVSLKWSSGDWKVKPNSNGSLHNASTSATGNTGFITWGAA